MKRIHTLVVVAGSTSIMANAMNFFHARLVPRLLKEEKFSDLLLLLHRTMFRRLSKILKSTSTKYVLVLLARVFGMIADAIFDYIH